MLETQHTAAACGGEGATAEWDAELDRMVAVTAAAAADSGGGGELILPPPPPPLSIAVDRTHCEFYQGTRRAIPTRTNAFPFPRP